MLIDVLLVYSELPREEAFPLFSLPHKHSARWARSSVTQPTPAPSSLVMPSSTLTAGSTEGMISSSTLTAGSMKNAKTPSLDSERADQHPVLLAHERAFAVDELLNRFWFADLWRPDLFEGVLDEQSALDLCAAVTDLVLPSLCCRAGESFLAGGALASVDADLIRATTPHPLLEKVVQDLPLWLSKTGIGDERWGRFLAMARRVEEVRRTFHKGEHPAKKLKGWIEQDDGTRKIVVGKGGTSTAEEAHEDAGVKNQNQPEAAGVGRNHPAAKTNPKLQALVGARLTRKKTIAQAGTALLRLGLQGVGALARFPLYPTVSGIWDIVPTYLPTVDGAPPPGSPFDVTGGAPLVRVLHTGGTQASVSFAREDEHERALDEFRYALDRDYAKKRRIGAFDTVVYDCASSSGAIRTGAGGGRGGPGEKLQTQIMSVGARKYRDGDAARISSSAGASVLGDVDGRPRVSGGLRARALALGLAPVEIGEWVKIHEEGEGLSSSESWAPSAETSGGEQEVGRLSVVIFFLLGSIFSENDSPPTI